MTKYILKRRNLKRKSRPFFNFLMGSGNNIRPKFQRTPETATNFGNYSYASFAMDNLKVRFGIMTEIIQLPKIDSVIIDFDSKFK